MDNKRLDEKVIKRREEIQKAFDYLDGVARVKSKREIERLLSARNARRIKDELEKSLNEGGEAEIIFDKTKNNFEVKNRINVNDIIEFEEKGVFQKAVVTALGKDGVTARDKQQQKVLVRFADIKDYEKRK